MTPKFAARAFAGLIAVVALFQLTLALGAPWGRFAMGGAFPGAYPPAMRVAALLQIVVLSAFALILLCRAGMTLPAWRSAARWPSWAVVGLMGVSVILNLITKSPMERLIWTPVALALFATSLRVAARPEPQPPRYAGEV